MPINVKQSPNYSSANRIVSKGTGGIIKILSNESGAVTESLVFTSFMMQTITGGESVTFNFFPIGPTPTLTTTYANTAWSLVDQFATPIANGTLPINNLRTLWATYALSSGQAYTMTASGITFTITRIGG
jgi:hypothetical protein